MRLRPAASGGAPVAATAGPAASRDRLGGLASFGLVPVLVFATLASVAVAARTVAFPAAGWVELAVALGAAAIATTALERARRHTGNEKQAALDLARQHELLAEQEAGARLLFANHPDPAWVVDAETLRFVEVNEAAGRAYGWSRARFLSMLLTDVEVPEDVLRATGASRLAPGESGSTLHRTSDGRIVEVELRSQPLHLDGRVVHMVVAQDVTEARRALHALEESEDRYALAMLGAADGLWDWNMAAGRTYLSARWKSMLGYAEDEVPDHVDEWHRRVHPEDRERLRARLSAHLAGETEHFEDEHRLLHADGSYRWMLVRGIAVRGEDGRPQRMAGSMSDISRRRANERRLRLQAAALDAAGNMIVITDEHGVVQYVNPAWCRGTGYSADEAVGKLLPDLDAAPERPEVREQMWQALRAGESWRGEVVNRRRDGSLYPEEQTITPIRDDSGAISHFVAIRGDITERKQHEDQLSYLADHDPLTGLLNRRALGSHLAAAVGAAARNRPSALLYLDLDQFKVVNDLFGHVSGDRLLVTLAGHLRAHMRDEDVVFRLGGDEFAVLLRQVDRAQAQAAAEKLRRLVVEFRFEEAGRSLDVGASVGVALIEPGCGPDEVLRRADAACYAAKSRGRNRVEVYEPGEAEQERLSADAAWSVRLKAALREDSFCLWFQPIQSIADGTIGHHEALLRLREPDGGLTPPGAFVPAAERFGLIHEIDRWVISAALRRIAEERDAGRTLRLALNLSGLAFHDDRTIDHVRATLAETRVDPDLVTFEITETAALTNLPLARRHIEALREMGCRFALDDFGSGFSSFAYLRFLPVDYLKIDGSFITGIETDLVSQTMVRSMTDVAHAMGVETIAEFVEGADALEVIGRLGVDYAQGFHIGRPAPEPVATRQPLRQVAPAGAA